MATAHLNGVDSTRLQSSKTPADLISLGEVCRLLGVSPQSVRNWAAEGKMPGCYRIGPAGWRKFSRREILDFAYGTETDEQEKEGVIVCYCRTSSQGQKHALVTQIIRVREYAQENYPGQRLIEISDNASGMNFNRPGLVRLIKMIATGEVDGGKLIVEFRDRLNRSALGVLETLCEARGVEIVVIEDDATKTDDEMLLEDVCAILHLFNMKKYAKRGNEKRAKPLAPAAICRGKDLADSGLGIQTIADTLTQEGHANQDGSVITFHQVRRYVSLNDALKKVQPKNDKNSVELYAERATKTDESCRTVISEVYDHYQEWCVAMNLTALPKRHLCKFFGGTRQIIMKDDSGKQCRTWAGLLFQGVPHRVGVAPSEVATNDGLDNLLSFVSKSRGFKGRLAGFQTNYRNWAASNGYAALSRSKVKTVLVQMGVKIRIVKGMSLLTL